MIVLDSSKCNGCVNCMKSCPTEAIRVENGKAVIRKDRCIECGACVRVCTSRAKSEQLDNLSKLDNYKYKIALPCPSIYGQFANLDNINYILHGLKQIGFDSVFEVAIGGQTLIKQTKKLLQKNDCVKPIISNTCAATIKLIQIRYEHLLDNITPFLSAEEITAQAAIRETLQNNPQLSRDDIGVFVISPCSAKAAFLADGGAQKCIDGFIAFKDIYKPLLNKMNSLRAKGGIEPITRASNSGVLWGVEGGETRSLMHTKSIYADGLENVISVLNDYDLDKLHEIEFFELSCCNGGCVGGLLNNENPYLARARIDVLSRRLSAEPKVDEPTEVVRKNAIAAEANAFAVSKNREDAIKKITLIKELYASLPGIDCGSCGAPTCMAFAEDVISGINRKCIYR